MMRFVIVLFTLGMSLIFGPTKSYASCDDAFTQAEMNQCAYQELSAAKELLAKALKGAEADLGEDHTAIDFLHKSQKQWQNFVDAECLRISDASRGGSIRPLYQASCEQALTERRAALLMQDRHEGAILIEANWQAMLDSDVNWRFRDHLRLDANCDGSLDYAVGGLRVWQDGGDDKAEFVLAISDGDYTDVAPIYWSLELAIGGDGQKSLCGMSVELELVEGRTAGCSYIRIDDQRCDAITVYIDPGSKELVWHRN